MLLKVKLLQNANAVIAVEFRLQATFLEAVDIHDSKHIYLISVKLFSMWL